MEDSIETYSYLKVTYAYLKNLGLLVLLSVSFAFLLPITVILQVFKSWTEYIIVKNKQYKHIVDLPPEVCLESLLLTIPMSALVERSI